MVYVLKRYSLTDTSLAAYVPMVPEDAHIVRIIPPVFLRLLRLTKRIGITL